MLEFKDIWELINPTLIVQMRNHHQKNQVIVKSCWSVGSSGDMCAPRNSIAWSNPTLISELSYLICEALLLSLLQGFYKD
jgi:hypothetical protein